jgi:hypothetical protein
MRKKKTQAEIIKEALDLHKENEKKIAELQKRLADVILKKDFKPLP